MSKAKVSVIIPVYNTEAYVEQAVESIINQTLQDIEIILINDGSTDNSGEVLKKLARKDRRIKLYHQPNQGQSVARNLGMQEASGIYIYFMDSDDLLEPEALEACYSKCMEYDLDFVIFDARIMRTDGKIEFGVDYYRSNTLNKKYIYSGTQAINKQLIRNCYSASPCLHVIKAEYLKRIGLTFYPGIIHEDELFTFKLYVYAERVMSIPRTFFNRRIRENSVMTQPFTWKNIHGYLTTADEIIKLYSGATFQVKREIDFFLPRMLNAAVYKGYVLPQGQRIRLFRICLSKYRKYVTARTLLVLLFKSYLKINGKH